MEFSISQESNLDGKKNLLIIELSNKLKSFFKDRQYGSSINHFHIGLICVKPEFETFFKVRKPRYKEVEKIKLLDGNEKELKGVYGYDIKITFANFMSNSDKESEKLIASEILQSLSNLEKLPKKVKDFDKERIKRDFEEFFSHE